MRNALPAVLLLVAALLGALGWHVLAGGGHGADGSAREGAARPDDARPDPARADGANGAGLPPPEPGVAPATAAEHAAVITPQRAAEALPTVDVHGWIVAAHSVGDAAAEHGHVVLRSVASSRAAVDATIAVDHGTFDAALPEGAIVRVAELVLDGKPMTCESQLFDLAQSRWLELRVTAVPPTILQVLDAVSGIELAGLQLADATGAPIPASRILATGADPTGQPGLASPITLAPTAPAGAPAWAPTTRGRPVTTELLRVGAPGHATLAIAVEHGSGAPIAVKLPLAAKLLVELAPWPMERAADGADGEPKYAVSLRRVEEHDDEPDPFFARPMAETPEMRRRPPSREGQVDYDDLAPGRWAVSVIGTEAESRGIPLLDHAIVDVAAGVPQRVVLDLTRATREGAILRVRAHDARDGTPIPIRMGQVRLRRLDGSWPTRVMEITRDGSSRPSPLFSEDGYLWTIAGAVEVTVDAHDERVWQTATLEKLLASGENVIDVPLVPASAVRVLPLVESRPVENSKASTIHYHTLAVEVRHRDGSVAVQSPASFSGRDEPLWIFEPAATSSSTSRRRTTSASCATSS
jgi:hypothetical protein